ncbi:MAG: TonB family protein [Acidobacteriota bacterium]|nr:TonB family protein [Acidobacteriota bacterium]
MPADLFDPASHPAPAGGGRRFTVTTSIAAHVIVVGLVIAAPLMGGISLPSAMERIDAFIAPLDAPPIPPAQPPAAPPRTSAVPNPRAAPLQAPESIQPEVSAPATPGATYVPGAIPVGPYVGVPGGLPGSVPGAAIAPPPPREQGPVRVGGAIVAPKRVSHVPPVYPAIAESARVEGTVILEAIINEAGVVTNVKVLKSVPLLDAAAREAVTQWRYTPTTLNGVKVSVIMTVTVTFTLR